MKKLYLWLSGVFTPCAIIHLARVAMKIRLDVYGHRIPLKVSAVIGIVSLLLAIVLFLLSKNKK